MNKCMRDFRKKTTKDWNFKVHRYVKCIMAWPQNVHFVTHQHMLFATIQKFEQADSRRTRYFIAHAIAQ